MTSVMRFLFLFAMATSIAIPALAQDSAESNESSNKPAGEPEKLVVSTFKEGMAKARQLGKPLVIFGLSDTWVRCRALEQGLTSDPDLQLLMTQFVSQKTVFGQADFKEIFTEITKKDNSIPRKIGAPCAFMFTPNGKHVYCGPAKANGIQVSEMKEIFVSAIKKHGAIVIPDSSEEAVDQEKLKADGKVIRKWVKEKKIAEAIAAISPYLNSQTETKEVSPEHAKLVELTGVEKVKGASTKSLDSLLRQITKAIEVEIKEGELKAIGEKIIEAQKLAEDSPEKAKEIYQELTKSKVPQVAAFAQSRLQPDSKPQGPMRIWTSSSGAFKMQAALVSFDDDTVTLAKKDGETIEVPIDKLSKDGVRYLKNQ